ncbi:MAG: hypothetical protein U9R38_03185 [Candidatus Margulisiibacteriota bacterium]|nr:hypothetical protein [Candidatus Margulisiibacteriota bacterium]
MALFGTRAVPKTIISRRNALTVSGNSRFARIANLTGTEVLLKVEKAAGRLARKAIDWFNFGGPQPGYAFAGTEGAAFLGGIERIDADATISRMANNSEGTKVGGKIIGSGNAVRGQEALKPDREESVDAFLEKMRIFEKEADRSFKIGMFGRNIGLSMIGVGAVLAAGSAFFSGSALGIGASVLLYGGSALFAGGVVLLCIALTWSQILLMKAMNKKDRQ